MKYLIYLMLSACTVINAMEAPVQKEQQTTFVGKLCQYFKPTDPLDTYNFCSPLAYMNFLAIKKLEEKFKAISGKFCNSPCTILSFNSLQTDQGLILETIQCAGPNLELSNMITPWVQISFSVCGCTTSQSEIICAQLLDTIQNKEVYERQNNGTKVRYSVLTIDDLNIPKTTKVSAGFRNEKNAREVWDQMGKCLAYNNAQEK